MTAHIVALALLLLLVVVAIAPTYSFEASSIAWSHQRLSTKLGHQEPSPRRKDSTNPRRRNCDPCEEMDLSSLNNNPELDRREAFFAMLGQLWALGILLPPHQAARAAYGEDARITLPNPLQGMMDRATKQCLVESLGNRECLVYMDEANKLYQGADSQILLERLEKASTKLATIPDYVQAKQWSQVSGVLMGPLGELVLTMGQLAALSEHADVCQKQIQIVKNDLYAMGAAVERKDGNKALASHAAATNSLVDFIKAL